MSRDWPADEPKLHLLRATIDDAGELLTVQRAAYVSEALLYDNPHLPPLTQTLAELRGDLVADPALKAMLGARIVGTVRVREDGDLLHVGRLAVAPDQQARGLGTALLLAAEDLAGAAVRTFALFTGADSEANLRLYARCGYREVGREALPTGPGLIHLHKPR
ncbi:MAG: GNAT family N-acetyltransferase [Mycobacteriales bacterium]